MLKRTFRWLFVEPLTVWTYLAVPLGLVLVGYSFSATEQNIRITGLVLQLVGISTAVLGVLKTRRYFGLESVRSLVYAWFARFPLKRRVVVGTVGVAEETNDAFAARGYKLWPTDPHATIEQRVEIVEKNIALMSDRISATQAEMDATNIRVGDQVRELSRTVSRQGERLDGRLQEHGTSGITITLAGAWCLFLGSALGSASNELYCLLTRFASPN